LTERRLFVCAAAGLWLVFFVQAVHTPVLLDDWFQLRYWRDHAYTPGELWAYGRHNYFHYNPRIGEVFLAIVDGSRAVHLVVTPLVQLAVLPVVFAIAHGRWPRPTRRDLEVLLFIQIMIWLVIPIPGILYFYRPIATNYLWAFTITLALFVPYRLALDPRPRLWLVPVMLVLGWVAGMCNEHTGPTAMVAMAAFLYTAWRARRLRAWMVAGAVGLYIGYPMLFFAPGQTLRYMGLATRETPVKLLADRGITGCIDIFVDFVHECRLGILMFVAALLGYLIAHVRRGDRVPALPRRAALDVALLAAASIAIVMTLFVSPTTTDRVFYAPGVLLAAACARCAEHLFAERSVRRVVVGACLVLFAYHVVRFIETYVAVKAENDDRIAALHAARPGTIAVVPSYDRARRTRWHLGDDFQIYPWLADYVGGELYDLARVDLDRRQRSPAAHVESTPPLAHVPTYREWQALPFARRAGISIRLVGLPFDRRPIFVVDGPAFVDGHPHDESRGHFIRIARDSLPSAVGSYFIIGCGETHMVMPLFEDAILLPVDERYCRGEFTALACEATRCWVAGWY